ncbi:MAG: glucokinase [Lautropia sp.]
MKPWPYPSLIADVGGTNLRLATLESAAAAPSAMLKFPTADFASMTDAIDLYRQRTGVPAPRSAAIAIAAPAAAARRGPIHLTNEDLVLDGAALARHHRLAARWIVNDFEALAWALPTFADSDLRPLGSALPDRQATMAVIGPGTGLGCAGLLRNPAGWHAIAGEGGHVTLSARSDFERAVLAAAAAAASGSHLSAERLLSGRGLPALFAAVAQVRGEPADDPLPAAPVIVDRARADAAAGRPDTLAGAAVATFCELLGGYAGNIALAFGAQGGVLIAGGVAQALADPLAAGGFRQRFEDKGRFRSYLQPIGTALILRELPAFDGLAFALRTAAAALPIQTD